MSGSDRRQVLGAGLGALAAGAVPGATRMSGPQGTHHRPRAKRLIYLFMNGAPSQIELFDPKPELRKLHGKPVPPSFVKGKRFSTMTGKAESKRLLAPLEPFAQHGESGAWLSRLLPYTASVADDLCFVKSLHTESVNHAPGINMFLSGAEMPGRPTLGAWLNYALGSECQDLPGFVVLTSVSKGTTCGQIFYDFYWGAGFLPSRFQGVKFNSAGDPVHYLSNPDGLSRKTRRGILDDLRRLNEMNLQRVGDPEIATRSSQYDMAFRMQRSVPELCDFSDEPAHVLESYGPGVHERGTFAYHCLLARRMIERGVRCVQLMHAGWDQHFSLSTELYTQCRDTDQPSAALVADLKQRGLLEDTLVVWGGEFGRTPFSQNKLEDRGRWGRDHHPYAFTKWLAGGGTRAGTSYGATDEIGMDAVEGRVHVHDMQATLLHLMGIDHERLTYRHQGRDFRLTDVAGKVVPAICG